MSRDPFVLYENRDAMTNSDALAARINSGEPVETSEAGPQPRLMVDDILIQNITGNLVDDRLPSPVQVSLGDLELCKQDRDPADLASQVMAPIISQIVRRAAEALVSKVTELITKSEQLQKQVDEGRQQLEEAAGNALNRVGNLFGGGSDDENCSAFDVNHSGPRPRMMDC